MSARLQHVFRLFIAGDTPNSAEAVANLTTLCRTHLAGHHAIEVVDVLRTPQRALDEGVMLTPTLLRLAPEPAVRIVGTLRDLPAVQVALGLAKAPA